MSEYMGMIYGKYDAKEGFVAGGGSLHSCMTPHGPDAETFYKASFRPDVDRENGPFVAPDSQNPIYFDAGLAFMFESTLLLKVSDNAINGTELDKGYSNCWSNIPNIFNKIKI